MRFWIVVISIAITFYSFFDCARTEQERTRGPKWLWLLVIFFFELFGALLWLFFGRPKNDGRGKKRKIIPPDDDPDFLRKL